MALSFIATIASIQEVSVLHTKHRDWLTARGLDADLAADLGLITVQEQGANWLKVPYLEDGKTINHKWRTTSEKRHRMDADAPLLLWNVDCLRDARVQSGHLPVIIAEGEWDAITAIQCGFTSTVSVPNGAPGTITDEPENAKRYEWVWRHLNDLDRVGHFILATDADQAGYNLAADLVALLGAERCKFLKYPDGCKDLNEVLLAHGKEAVVDCIAAAKPYPIQGLFRLSDFPERGEMRSYSVGVRPISDMISIVPGTLTVVTGYANQGKSTLLNAIVAHTVQNHFPVCVASFETETKPILENGILASMVGCSFSDAKRLATKEQLETLENNLTIISQSVDEDLEIDLNRFLELARITVVRDGVKMLLLDPWNEIEHKRPAGMSETEYTSSALRTIKRFARQHQVAVWIIAHPAKPSMGATSAPGLYDISGCHSADTEVLTKRGWITHDLVTHEDEIACFDLVDSSLTYQRPSRIIKQPFEGELFRLKGYGFDQCVTPDHRMVLKPMWSDPVGSQSETGLGRPTRWPKGEWSFCEAQLMPSAPFAIPLAAPLKDMFVEEISLPLAQLAGWFVSEGCWMSSGIGLAQAADTDGARKIEDLLTTMAIPFTITRGAPGGKGGKLTVNTYYIGVRGAREVVDWLREHCGKGSANKRIPDAIRNGSSEIKSSFLSAYLDGDGHLRTNGTYSATTTSEILRDQLQAIAVELGMSCCWHGRPQQSENHAPSWSLSFGREARSQTSVRTYRSLTKVPYSGDVWCLTVPTGAYVTRRNGKASISGNSAHWANKADYGLTYHRPRMDENFAQIVVCKVRMGMPGKRGEVGVSFDFRTSEFRFADQNAA